MTVFDAELRRAQPVATSLLEAAITRGHLANAYLFVGRATADKWNISKQLACYINCSLTDKAQRGSCPVALPANESQWCRDCSWITNDQHPQAWLSLIGEGRSQKIPVEKVRNLSDELGKTSNFARVTVVPDASEEIFHRPAANALLKLIEEPPTNALFLFFSDSADEVLSTIVSRCQAIPVTQRLELGFWPNLDRSSNAWELKNRLDAGKAAIAFKIRQLFKPVQKNPLKVAHDGRELAQQMTTLAEQLEDILAADDACVHTLDLVVAAELDCLRTQAADNPKVSRYLVKLVSLAEKAKLQLSHYVKPANVFETFSLSLSELRHEHSGELSLAER